MLCINIINSPLTLNNMTNNPQITDTHLHAPNITEGKFSGVVISSTLPIQQRLLLMLAGMVQIENKFYTFVTS